MRRRRPTWIVVVAVLAAAAPALSWGRDGHRVVADIAERRLRQKAKDGIKDLLGSDSLADVSNWADAVRGKPRYAKYDDMHYVNVDPSATKVDPARDCKDGKCALDAVRKFSQRVLDKNYPRQKRVEALMFLVHFVGDIHQPLHVSYKKDLGGNFIDVDFLGDAGLDLHKVWDTALVTEARKARQLADWRGLREALDKSIDPADAEKWTKEGGPLEWANESLEITRSIYAAGPKTKLDSSYVTANVPVVEDRLKRAGVRLAAVLNAVFEGTVPPQAVAPKEAEGELAAVAARAKQGQIELTYDQAWTALWTKVDDDHGFVRTFYDDRVVDASDAPPTQKELRCEHVWRFKTDDATQPGFADLHAMRPTTPYMDKRTRSLPFGTPDEIDPQHRWEIGLEDDRVVFLPPVEVRGDVARSLFYFAARYGVRLGEGLEADLRDWHFEDPPDARERARAEAVAAVQGNRNPFIDEPALVDAIEDF
jgi:hypothetical protein